MFETSQPELPQSLNQGQSDTWWLGVAVAAFAVIAGQAVMALGEAPLHQSWVNGLTMLAGAILFPTLVKGLGWTVRWPVAAAAAAAVSVLLTAGFGLDIEGVSRWAGAAWLRFHVGHVALPFAIAAAARSPGPLTAAALVALSFGLALQPDSATSVALACALAVLLALQFHRWTALGLASAVLAALYTVLWPDNLSPRAWAEGLFVIALAMGPLTGFLVTLGLTFLPAPFVFVMTRGHRRRPLAGAFAAYWTVLVLAPLVGNFPPPLVGYGAGPVLGYVLSWALLRLPASSPDSTRQR